MCLMLIQILSDSRSDNSIPALLITSYHIGQLIFARLASHMFAASELLTILSWNELLEDHDLLNVNSDHQLVRAQVLME